MIDPKKLLIDGARLLEPILGPHGFQFQFSGEGKGSGGTFASGEFVRGVRRLELHFRHGLGLVTYHTGGQSVSHVNYMQELGFGEVHRYPGFSDDPIAAFHDLAHDLTFADDFLSGDAGVLLRAAKKQSTADGERSQQLMAGYAGDTRKLEEMKEPISRKAIWRSSRPRRTVEIP